jgi:hypothetical protein
MERRHLAEAERQIISGELHVTAQRMRIDEMERGGGAQRFTIKGIAAIVLEIAR